MRRRGSESFVRSILVAQTSLLTPLTLTSRSWARQPRTAASPQEMRRAAARMTRPPSGVLSRAMKRIPQPLGDRGSLRWIQHFVNNDPGTLNSAIGLGKIAWVSPLKEDAYSEYRDDGALEKLEVKLTRRPLSSFWPARGPQWDALGIGPSREPVLVEAKAHIGEILSPASKASPKSLKLIHKSLRETAKGLGVVPGGVDWSRTFYQYTNRLAHAYFLRELNGIPAHLVFLYFVGDDFKDGPKTAEEWRAATAVLHEAIGLRGCMPSYVEEIFLEVPIGLSR